MTADTIAISRPFPLPLPFSDLVNGTVTDAPLVWNGAAWVNEKQPLDGIIDGTITNGGIIWTGTAWVNKKVPLPGIINGTVTDGPLVWNGAAWVNELQPIDGISPTGGNSGQVLRSNGGSVAPAWGAGTSIAQSGAALSPRSADGALILSGGINPSITGVNANLVSVQLESYSSPSKLLISVQTSGVAVGAGNNLFTISYPSAFTNYPLVIPTFESIGIDTVGPSPIFGGVPGVFTITSSDKQNFTMHCTANTPLAGTFHIGVLVIGD